MLASLSLMASWRIRRVAGRVATLLATIIASLLVCFALSAMTPGDAFTQLELDPAIPPATLAALRARYAAQSGVTARLRAWATGLERGKLGYSLAFHRPVASLLRERAPATLRLLGLAFVLAWLLALFWALSEALLAHSRLGALLHGASGALAAAWSSLPVGFVAVVALIVAPVAWLAGLADFGGGRAVTWPWLAAAVLACEFIPALYLQTAQALQTALGQPFVVAARARGLSRARVLWKHVVPNTFDTLIPLGSLTVTQLLVDTVIVETLLGWPGLGQLAVSAAAQRDLPLLSAIVLLTSLLVIATGIVSDLLQLWTNPRLRLEGEV